jgi:Nitrile hydratase beta subunit, C-terminal
VAQPQEARFKAGDHVCVKNEERPGHVRTPHYIRGKTGRIEALHGVFRNPESLAYGGNGLPRRPLYLVGFSQSEVWGARYRGAPRDRLYVDIFDHWLEPASGSAGEPGAGGAE